MENLLHFVWKHKLFTHDSFITTKGESLEIIDTGIHNHDAGADFFNAKVKIVDKVWAGNVEIHVRSSDWYKHGHDQDKSYDSVILHVVAELDQEEIRDSEGRLIPQWVMQYPKMIYNRYQYLLSNHSSLPCAAGISMVNPIYLSDWMSALLSERLEQKTQRILDLLDQYGNDWNEVFYITLARNFGFGVNNDAFERLAKSLSLKYIAKHNDSRLQVEALFLGQAGLLDVRTRLDDYYAQLQKEYFFLKKKFGLRSLDGYLFKNLRVRPNNFPYIKIVQLATLIQNGQSLFSTILSTEDVKEYAKLFITEVSEYWLNHYVFGKESTLKPKTLGTSSIHILLINTVAPILFAYGKMHDREIYMDRAGRLLESLPAEKNHIITQFRNSGIKSATAADSQALIQLKREYCEKKKCIYCRIGFRLLRVKNE